MGFIPIKGAKEPVLLGPVWEIRVGSLSFLRRDELFFPLRQRSAEWQLPALPGPSAGASV